MPERPEVLSTARPTPLRLWGFLCLVAGVLVTGFGAVSDWAVLGFAFDAEGALDAPVKGVDIWEGQVVLGVAVLVLVGMLATRLVLGTERRRVLAFGIASLGALVVALALSVAVRVDARLGGTNGLDTLAADLAADLNQDPADVRQTLEAMVAEELSVDVRPGLWVVVAGGVLIDLGGALTLAWLPRRHPPAPGLPAET